MVDGDGGVVVFGDLVAGQLTGNMNVGGMRGTDDVI